jgi:hypothetical protein
MIIRVIKAIWLSNKEFGQVTVCPKPAWHAGTSDAINTRELKEQPSADSMRTVRIRFLERNAPGC